MKKVHVVNHTHWDREWYFTTMDALMLSDNLFTGVINELKNNPDAKFCLDGQTSILNDYIELHPEKLDDIKELIKNKKLSIGPWYTQTDAFFVNEESFIRNLIIGIRDSKKYGVEMPIGYLPDTFGLNAQMPTILKNCGLDSIVFWRGINFKKHVSGPYFNWKGLGDKEIVAANLVDGYGTAAFLKNTDEYLNERLLPAVKKIESYTDLNELLIPAGGDQLEIIKNLPQVLKGISEKTNYKFIASSYEDFIDYLSKNNTNLPSYEGEFREPVTTRAHKSIGSVRYDIKRSNFLVEQKLLRRIEPLIAIGAEHGIVISTELLIKTWKKLLEGHAHDSMGGCVSDDVAIDILHRIKEADEIADGIENYIVKRISEKLGLSQKQVLVFNTTSKPYSGFKVIDFLSSTKNIQLQGVSEAVLLKEEYFEGKKNLLLETPEGPKYINEDPYYRLHILANISIPSMGYKVLNIEEISTEISELVPVDSGVISNEFYSISYNDTGLRLETKFGESFQNFLEFENVGNAGDTYDFSPLEKESPVLLNLALKEVKKSNVYQEMILTGTFKLPKTIESREGKTTETGLLHIDLKLTLQKDSNLIDAKLVVDNQIMSHRLRVKLNTGVKNRTSIASLPFGFIERESLSEEIPRWDKEYVEYPIDLEPFDKSVSVGTDMYHINAFGKGIKEYQFQDGSLYLTLFASTSQLGKPNLAYRPGRASGDTTKKGHVMIPTPMAELKGKLEFEFSISAIAGKFNEYTVSKQWETYQSESISYQNQVLNKFIHRLDNKIQSSNSEIMNLSDFSLLSVETKGFDSSLIPSMYDNNSFVLRLTNPTNEPMSIHNFNFEKFTKYEFVNCREDIIETERTINPYDMISIKLWK